MRLLNRVYAFCDVIDAENEEPDRTEDGYPDHVWDNNGLASKVEITA